MLIVSDLLSKVRKNTFFRTDDTGGAGRVVGGKSRILPETCYICSASQGSRHSPSTAETAKVKDIISIPVRVNPALREYLVCIHGGSPVIALDYKGPVWTVVKTNLELVPGDWKPEHGRDSADTIRLMMPSAHSGRKLYNQIAGAVIQTNYLYRCHLSEHGQRQVEQLLMKSFKQSFRHYMAGYLSNVSAGKEPRIKDAINSFCDMYHLTMDHITYEMLKKDWSRFRNRETPWEPSPEIKESI